MKFSQIFILVKYWFIMVLCICKNCAGMSCCSGSSSDNLLHFLEQTSKTGQDLASNDYEYLQSTPVEVVVGNEACDLDSAVSAILYAFFIQRVVVNNERAKRIVLPMLNIKRSEFALKTEVIYVLAKVLLDNADHNRDMNVTVHRLQSLLIFRDSIDMDRLHAQKRLKLRMVDHNALSDHLKHLQQCVVDIVDHHQVCAPSTISNIATEIEMVGSCTTLVYLKIHGHHDKSRVLNEKVCMLAYYTILTDTVNLSPAAKKTTPKDIQAINAVESHHQPSCSRQDMFDSVMQAKADVTMLSVDQLMEKDKKVVQSTYLAKTVKIGFSSIPISFAELDDNSRCRNKELSQELHSYMQSEPMDALIVLPFFQNSMSATFRRQIAVVCADSKLLKHILAKLRTLDLKLKEVVASTENQKVVVRVFDQENLSLSRKQILPAIIN